MDFKLLAAFARLFQECLDEMKEPPSSVTDGTLLAVTRSSLPATLPCTRKGKTMSVRHLLGAASIAAGGLLVSAVPTEATMYPITHYATPYVQHVDCAAGFHVGPVGTCIIGTEEPHDRVMERRDDHVGCDTKSVTRQDEAGNSETKTKTNC
jgi:hypothetical protein